MVSLFVVLAIGILIGWLLRRSKTVALLLTFNRLLLPLLYAFLFFIGLSVGTNPTLIQAFGNLLSVAALLALGGMVGSMLLVHMGRRWLTPSPYQVEANNGVKEDPQRQRKAIRQSLCVSLTATICFVGGIGFGVSGFSRLSLSEVRLLAMGLLHSIMFLVGVGFGSDQSMALMLRSSKATLLVLPTLTAIGTLCGAAVVGQLLPHVTTQQALGVTAGMGYYSLSSVMITNLQTPMLGLIALMVNLIREIVTIGLGPWVMRLFGPLELIAMGATTSGSSALPTISLCAGKQFVLPAVVSGTLLEIAVPVIILLVFHF